MEIKSKKVKLSRGLEVIELTFENNRKNVIKQKNQEIFRENNCSKLCYFKKVFAPSPKLFVTYHWLLVFSCLKVIRTSHTIRSRVRPEQSGKE